VPEIIQRDKSYLSSFGELIVLQPLWRALRRFDVWIEPELITEWCRLMAYAAGQGRQFQDTNVVTAMMWSEPAGTGRGAPRLRKALAACGTGRTPLDLLDVEHYFP